VETFIIDKDNNFKKGATYKNVQFKKRDPVSGFIPVLKSTINDKLPCKDDYLDIFDPKTAKFKNINHKFPLATHHLAMTYTGKKYIVGLSNQVIHGINFHRGAKKITGVNQYDEKQQLIYDYSRYSNTQTNLIILNDKFQIENNFSYPSRSATSIESMIATDENTIYFFGMREDLMSIDKFSGF